MRPGDLSVLHIAGPDMALRLPSILQLKQRGVQVHAAGSGSSQPFDDVGVPFYPYELNGSASPLADRKTNVALAEIIREVKPHVVHSFSTKPCVLVPPVARMLDVPVNLRTVCGLGHLYSSNSLKAKLMRIPFLAYHRRASRTADMTIFQNEDDWNLFREKSVVRNDNSMLIPGSGVDITGLAEQIPNQSQRAQLREEMRASDGPIVMMVARLVRAKGVDLFLESARTIRKEHPEATFVLVGPLAKNGRGIPLSTIESYSDDVTYLGYRKDIPALLSMADIFALPSQYREGVPRVLMEAAALGLGLVTTNMPGCKDVVINEETGLRIEPGDQQALNVATTRLIESPSLRAELGSRALARIRDRFEVSHVVDSYINTYSNILGQPITTPTRKAA
ncbi:MAG: glycosyltransferase family 4 protein [Planctomycetaceae bacterium]